MKLLVQGLGGRTVREYERHHVGLVQEEEPNAYVQRGAVLDPAALQ